MRRVLTLVAVLGLLGCGSGEPDFPRDSESLMAESRTFQSRLTLSGGLVAKDSTSVNAPNDGYGLVIRWMAEDGSLVKKGDKVIEMETGAVASQVESLESAVIAANNAVLQQRNQNAINRATKAHALRQAEFDLEKAQADADVPEDAYPKRVYEDMQLALGRSKAAHVNAKEALAVELKVAKSSLAQKRIAFERAKRELKEAYEKLEGYVLTAPRDGLLVPSMSWRDGRPLRAGDKTWPGQPIVEIPNLAVMDIKAELSDVDDGQVHVGMRASCVLDAYPDTVYEGHVVSVSPVARKASRDSLRRVFDVVVELAETDTERMRPGMSARVEVMGAPKEGAIVVPRAAIVVRDTSAVALLANGSQSDVVLGPCNAQECVIESGLTAGTRLSARGREE